MENSFSLIDHLAAHGWASASEFFPLQTMAALLQEAQALWRSDVFNVAGIGRGGEFKVRADIRSDHVLWLYDNNLTVPQREYRAAIEALRQELNAQLYVGLQEFEAHYAVYPPGAFYQKHLDRFSTADERIISCSLYLNPNWSAADGGALRLYEGARSVEIYPKAGTFVIFRSDTIYHEVLPALRERFSLTGWFKRRPLERCFQAKN